MASRRGLGVMVFVVLSVVALAAAATAQASSIFFIRSGEIWVANPDGSGAKQVTSDGGSGQPYVWVSAAKGSSPILAYLRDNTAGGSPQQVYGTINPDGTGSAVNPDNYPNMQPYAIPWGTMVSIDPAGDRVSWPSSRASFVIGYTYYYAFSVGVNGTGETHLDTADAQHVTFGDPAGQTLLFQDLTSGYTGLPSSCVSSGVHSVLVHQTPAPTSGTPGTPAFYCASGGADLTEPALRPDGQAIVAVQGGTPGSIVTIPIGGTATSSAVSPIAATGVTGTNPDFSPDGTQIAFEGTGSTIDTVPAGGGTASQILTSATSPAWSPYSLPGSGSNGGGGGGGGGGGTGHVAHCRVPKLTGDTLAQAQKALKRAGCKLGKKKSAFSSKVKRGRVISQSPKAGKVVSKGTAVGITLSKGKHH